METVLLDSLETLIDSQDLLCIVPGSINAGRLKNRRDNIQMTFSIIAPLSCIPVSGNDLFKLV